VRVVALIPARGGSKGIPRKNLRPVAGKPLIAWSIEAARQCIRIERVIVSTDDPEIAEAGRASGAEVPFLRPAELALDTTPDQPVLLHTLDWLQTHGGLPDVLVLLRPTCPVRPAGLIDQVIEKLSSSGCDSVRTAHNVGHEHPYWMMRLEDDRATPFLDGYSVDNYYQRQMLPPLYRHNGVVDAFRVSSLRESASSEKPNAIYGRDVRFVVLERDAYANIDSSRDLALAELLLRERGEASHV
jgi:CMP-N,N'-diacetyllegionaminic acid synthase